MGSYVSCNATEIEFFDRNVAINRARICRSCVSCIRDLISFKALNCRNLTSVFRIDSKSGFFSLFVSLLNSIESLEVRIVFSKIAYDIECVVICIKSSRCDNSDFYASRVVDT